jgi:uncharacterized radical SAM protein YgiQ
LNLISGILLLFLPTTKNEIQRLGWDSPDVILVTGDSYIDSPFIGVSIIGKYLLQAGYRVAVIAQPDIYSGQDITRLGEPRLFWGISGGCVDSMIANYTALKKKRKSDDFTPGGRNNRRPDRAVIVYTNLIRQWFKNTVPIVLGGIEASLRRISHYDYWSNQIRKSILFDAKADILVYGMGEKTVMQLADHLKAGLDFRTIRGLCYISKEIPEGYIRLPDFDTVVQQKSAFIQMFHTFYQNNDPINVKGLVQKHDSRYLIQNPPAEYPSQQELDEIYNLDFERSQHPFYERQGKVKALETIKFSITSHRGCYGECNFCAIVVHQGRTIRWRSIKSIVTEARQLLTYPDFKGYILDVGGPTANMYGFECDKKQKKGACKNKRCIFPKVCSSLKVNHEKQIRLLQKLRSLPGVKKVFVASGLRYDLILADRKYGLKYLKQLIKNHISGQLKIAPEHSEGKLLTLMGKPGRSVLVNFINLFNKLNKSTTEKNFLTYYLIAAHPGCQTQEMHRLKKFTRRELKINPEQVQIYIPAPSTYSSVMYYTETNPFTGERLFVEKNMQQKARQKQIITMPKVKNK